MASPESKPPKLYNYPLSFGCQIVRLCAFEKGVIWREITVDGGPDPEVFDPWFVALTPAMELPVLSHGGRIFAGAQAICRYLDGAFDGPLLDHRDEAQTWIDLVESLPIALLTAARFPRFGRRLLQRRFLRLEARAATNPELAELYGRKATEIDRLARDLSSPERIAAVERQLEVVLDRAEAALAHRPFLTGDRFTLADVFWAALLARLTLLGHDRLWSADRRAGLAAYWTRLQDRRSFARAGLRTQLSLSDLASAVLRSHWSGLLRIVLALTLAAVGFWLWRNYA